VTSPVPEDAAFYPRLDSSAIVPARGFGIEVGAHVYLLNIGPSRLGLGASYVGVRAVTKAPPSSTTTPGTGTAPPVGQSLQLDMRTLAPHVSFNFGSGDGWSYVSGGLATTTVVTRTTGSITGRRESDRLNGLSVGGGARWFLASHIAFSFDVRLHRLSSGTAGPIEETPPPANPPAMAASAPTPSMTFIAVSAGFSFK
jgi:hypothetical protein